LPVMFMHSQMQIGDSDIALLQQAYQILSGQQDDKVLERALHRFLLGRQRLDLLDRFVDCVIAWESLLLTNNKQSTSEEVSYRFRINGATILHAAKIETNRINGLKIMKGFYSVRSKIVHGASNKDIDAEIKKAGVSGIQEICNDLEEIFRRTVFWLANLKAVERPYNKEYGWEQLIWGISSPDHHPTRRPR
jgi:hypothetical protein